MKKTCCVMLFLLMAFVTQADMVDDFENYDVGALGDVASPPWTAETTGLSNISADAGNQYITFAGDSDWRHFYRDAGVEISALSTLYFRVYVVDEATDHAFGMTDEAAPSWYSAYGAYVRVTDDTSGTVGVASLDTRDGGGFVDDIATLNVGQWYNIWLVIDPTNASGTFDVYCTPDGVSAEGATASYTGAGFRKAYANPLITFLMMSGQNAGENVRVDDVYVLSGSYLGIPISGLPYAPSVDLVQNGTKVDVTLAWKAAADPDLGSGNAVNPDIVDQYVFVGSDTDPNMRYVGATGVDPGTEDPNSEYFLAGKDTDEVYYWAVVEAIEGNEQILTPGTSLIDDVDPNNIIGPVWSFESLKAAPVVTDGPDDTRVFATETATFTVLFDSISTATVKWFKYVDGVNDDELADGGNISITTDPVTGNCVTTLEIANAGDADQGMYYCTIVNLSGEEPVQSDMAILVIKKLLAEYAFEEDLLDGTAEGNDGTAKDLSLADPNLGVLTYVEGISPSTYAVSLDGVGQYVDFGADAYPKAGTISNGIGAGMDEGSILCWVKASATGTVYLNYNDGATEGVGLSVNAAPNARINIRGQGFAAEYQEIGTAEGRIGMTGFDLYDGQWHMIGSTWAAGDTLRVYVDGEVVASVGAGSPDQYLPWQRGVLLGASRTSADRSVLTDFLNAAIDELRVYNYVITSDAIAQEYMTVSGNVPCADPAFTGNAYNFDNSAASYCKVDLADFAVFAQNWLANGLLD